MDDLNFGVKMGSESGPTGISSSGVNKPKYETMVEEKGAGEAEGAQKKGDYDLSAAAHPVACIFTFLFKTLAVVMYRVGNADTSSVGCSSILQFWCSFSSSSCPLWTSGQSRM